MWFVDRSAAAAASTSSFFRSETQVLIAFGL